MKTLIRPKKSSRRERRAVLRKDLSDRRGLPRLTAKPASGGPRPRMPSFQEDDDAVSKHNITGKIRGSASSYIINALTRNADLLDPETAQQLATGTIPDPAEFIAHGYLIEPEEEARLFRAAYLDFLDRSDAAEIQLFFVPWYHCNFACPYCYQEGYAPEAGTLDPGRDRRLLRVRGPPVRRPQGVCHPVRRRTSSPGQASPRCGDTFLHGGRPRRPGHGRRHKRIHPS